MSDVFERLREANFEENNTCCRSQGHSCDCGCDAKHQLLLQDAANEIERLRERCEAYKGQIEAGATAIATLQGYRVKAQDERDAARAHVERLTAALQTINRTTFSGSEQSEDYMRGNLDAHKTCASLARAALAPQDQQPVAHTADEER